MGKYIKSHSNYRLSTKHQETQKGTVLERDISTIGGVDTFATGQSTIYSSGNFVMTVNNETTASRHVLKKGWLSNTESGETWTAHVLENYTSDIDGSVEKSIQVKNDFMDLKSFACYGSLYDLIQHSITDILNRYPYEIYTDDGNAKYNKHTLEASVDASSYTYSGSVKPHSSAYSVSTNFVEFLDSGSPVTYVSNYSENLYETSNPALIDMHTVHLDESDVTNELRYFANGGYGNYSIFDDLSSDVPDDGYSFTWNTIQKNKVTVPSSTQIIDVVSGNTSEVNSGNTSIFNVRLGSDYYNTHAILQFSATTNISLVRYVNQSTTSSVENSDIYSPTKGDNTIQENEDETFGGGDGLSNVTDSPNSGDMTEEDTGDAGDKDADKFDYVKVATNLTFNAGDTLYIRISEKGDVVLNKSYCPEVGDYVCDITLIPTKGDTITLLAFRDYDLEVKYLVTKENLFLHIRPKPSLSYYDNFIESLNIFQKTLLGYFSGEKNTAKFEILRESDRGTERGIQTFKFPFGSGGYNLDTEGYSINEYIRDLAKIGTNYDNMYTDNMYRMLTHESLKNFDWTKNFNGYDNDSDNEYIDNGERLKSMIRVMGYVFDNEKTYIDSISNSNIITYNNRANLPDYFLTDSLEVDGWDVTTIYPYDLKEFDRETGQEVDKEDWSDKSQEGNMYQRKFSENTTEIITPYIHNEGGWYFSCSADTTVPLEVDDGQRYFLEGDVLKNVTRDYSSNDEYTIPDINNIFMKNLRINSRHILRKKGTVEGIESILSLFGYRSKRWYDSLNTTRVGDKFKTKYGKPGDKRLGYDFEINEYVGFAAPINETWDKPHNMYRVDYLNSCKTVPYNTTSFLNGEYISYQGLPIAYRDIPNEYIACHEVSGETVYYNTKDVTDGNICTDENDKPVNARKLYPDFESSGIYDGNMYYQMNGGWIMSWPYSFDTNSDIVVNNGGTVNKETLRNIKQVQNLEQLLSQPISELKSNAIYYVNDLSKNYAILNGQLYDLFSEVNDDGKQLYYIKAKVLNGSVSLGSELFTEYLNVSNPYYDDGEIPYYLPGYDNGYVIKIYYTPDKDDTPFTIFGYDSIRYYRTQEVSGTTYREECSAEDEGAIKDYENLNTLYDTHVFLNGSYYSDASKYTHYFKLENVYEPNSLASDGWSQLSINDTDYLRKNSIVDNYKGNNPHSGGDGYDNGYEYMRRFSKLFKYASDNDLFDESCFLDSYEVYEEIANVGFENLTEEYDYITSYEHLLHKDKKAHSFCDVLSTENKGSLIGKCVTSKKISGGSYVRTSQNLYLNEYNIDNVASLSSKTDYEYLKEVEGADGVSNQIVNTKVIDIKFYLQSEDFHSKECQEEVKFIQDNVMHYVEQILPSTAIIKLKMYTYPYKWILEGEDVYDNGTWHDEFNWTDDGIWFDGE